MQVTFGIGFVNRQAADNMQAYFVAEAALNTRNAAVRAEGKPLEDVAAFDKEWRRTHPTPATPIVAVLDQIDYAVKLIGIDHVGLGSDFDGVSGNLPEGLRNVADYPNLVAGLQARGYKDDGLKKILGGNLLWVWATVDAGGEQQKR